MASIYDLYAAPDDATGIERANALASALQSQQGMGMLLGMSGDKVMAPMAEPLLQGSQAGLAQLAAAGSQRGSQNFHQQQAVQGHGWDVEKDASANAWDREKFGLTQQQQMAIQKLQEAGEWGRQKAQLTAQMDLENRRIEAGKYEAKYGIAAQNAQDERAQRQVERLDKSIGPIGSKASKLSQLESDLGAMTGQPGPVPLESFDTSNGLRLNGRNVDLPGVNVPGVGRMSGYSGAARQLEGSVSSILNEEIKDTAGAVVTSNEMERIKTQYNAGKYNTEGERIKALQDYKRAMNGELQRREAAFSPQAVQAYGDRGGFTSGSRKEAQQTKVVNGVPFHKVGPGPDDWETNE